MFFTEGKLLTIISGTFVIHSKNMKSDGNCKYRAITNMLSFGEDGWAQVRRDMLIELNGFSHRYEGVYRCSEHLEEIRHALNHFNDGASVFHCF